MRQHERTAFAPAPKAPATQSAAARKSRPGLSEAARIGAQRVALQSRPSLPAAIQRQAGDAEPVSAPQRNANRTGLPDRLKAGVEALSGLSLDDVRVHYGSSRPAQLHAHAYTQGAEIHVAPGQERHLAHEAWHVVQQKQDRVPATLQLRGIDINDDAALEREADRFGDLAAAWRGPAAETVQLRAAPAPVLQMATVTASNYAVSLTDEFTKNHLRTSKAAALSRSRKRALPVSTIINSNNANVKTTVEGSELADWRKPDDDERYFQSFNLPHWQTTKDGTVYTITNEQTAALRLGAYFKQAEGKAVVSHLG
ncbi:MAG: DUF4157 domain-containing protein [Sphingomonadaceae bacterium]|nr:DUF4157 domain-containing protein [Sphingomonadaceae bacterium]